MAKHVRVRVRHPYAGGGGQAFEPTRRSVPVHPGTDGVAQDQPGSAAVDSAVGRPGHRWRRR
jgi:hypothetical protein